MSNVPRVEPMRDSRNSAPASRLGSGVPVWLRRWVDSHADDPAKTDRQRADRIDWLRSMPFFALHLACVGVIWTGWSAVAVWTAVGLYLVRMFAITGFYHRYFSHRSFKTSRWFQAIMAWIGCSSAQRDPMWWAAHHVHHHAHADDPDDVHSPVQSGFFRSHVGWILTPANFLTRRGYVRDWQRYPEIRFLNRFDWIAPLILAIGLFVLGDVLAAHAPQLQTDGWQMLVWGFFVSTVVLYHATFTVNSLAHTWGSRRFRTSDESRNNGFIAILTLGEGWHNNHHHYPTATRQGFFWWEIDLTYYALRILSWLGLVWDLRPVPARVLMRNRLDGEAGEPAI